MNGKLKKELKAAFEAPSPADRERFLNQLRYPKITYQAFLLSQLRYIRKRVWIAAALLVLLGCCLLFQLPEPQHWQSGEIKIWSISAVLPFLAMITVTELYRSAAYSMEELEGSCRFSLPQIVMARISILGAVNFVVLGVLVIFIKQVSAYSLMQTMFYSMMPYLIVCVICLRILNRAHGAEGIYTCSAATGLVSVISIICENAAGFLYSDAYRNGWLVFFAGCFVLIGFQLCKLIKQLEEKQWNLTLTE